MPTRKKTSARATGVELKGLPVLWALRCETQAVGLHLDDREVWGGWQTGEVVACDHAGRVLRRWRLPAGVDALVADEAWRYAGCHDGTIYNLTGRTPRAMYQLEGGAEVRWIDIHRGSLCASDEDGCAVAVDPEGTEIFRHAPTNAAEGWMLRADDSAVYLGNSRGVTKLDWRGKKIWHTKTNNVGFGWQERDRVFVFAGDAKDKRQGEPEVMCIDKATGEIVARGLCRSNQLHYNVNSNAASCAAGRDGKVMYGSTAETLFCFDAATGKPLWQSRVTVGTPCSMAYHRDRLFVATHLGFLACMDVSAEAIAAAQKTMPKNAKAKRLGPTKLASRKVEVVNAAKAKSGKGVLIECVKESGKLRVRVVSPGYNVDWFCQFPRDIREDGARYLVDEVREASQGGFYRVLGDIKRVKA